MTKTKFFIPHADDELMAADVWQRLRDRYGSADEKIFSLAWEHKGSIHRAEVGKEIEKWPEHAGIVIAMIRGADMYMVFTA